MSNFVDKFMNKKSIESTSEKKPKLAKKTEVKKTTQKLAKKTEVKKTTQKTSKPKPSPKIENIDKIVKSIEGLFQKLESIESKTSHSKEVSLSIDVKQFSDYIISNSEENSLNSWRFKGIIPFRKSDLKNWFTIFKDLEDNFNE